MLEGEGGSIINTASVLGLIGSEGYAAYGAAKAGLVALTRRSRPSTGRPVRANVIAPGSIDTPRFRKVLDETPDAEEFLRGPEAQHPAPPPRSRRRHRRHRAVPRERPVGVHVGRGHPGRRRPGGAAVGTDGRTSRRQGRGRHRRRVRARRGDLRPVRGRGRRPWSSPTSTKARPARRRARSTRRGHAAIEPRRRRDEPRARSRRWSTRSSNGTGGSTCSCAARRSRRVAPVVDLGDDDWQRVLDVNLKGPFLCMKHAIPAMVDERRRVGRRCSGSVLGAIGAPGYAAYCASKGALVNLASRPRSSTRPTACASTCVVAVGDRHRTVHEGVGAGTRPGRDQANGRGRNPMGGSAAPRSVRRGRCSSRPTSPRTSAAR